MQQHVLRVLLDNIALIVSDCLCCHTCVLSAVFKFLLAQKNLKLTDIARASITEDSVAINYVHGIWYQVRSVRGAVNGLGLAWRPGIRFHLG
jgi:iron only hydrogenase large subunit-like protein